MLSHGSFGGDALAHGAKKVVGEVGKEVAEEGFQGIAHSLKKVGKEFAEEGLQEIGQNMGEAWWVGGAYDSLREAWKKDNLGKSDNDFERQFGARPEMMGWDTLEAGGIGGGLGAGMEGLKGLFGAIALGTSKLRNSRARRQSQTRLDQEQKAWQGRIQMASAEDLAGRYTAEARAADPNAPEITPAHVSAAQALVGPFEDIVGDVDAAQANIRRELSHAEADGNTEAVLAYEGMLADLERSKPAQADQRIRNGIAAAREIEGAATQAAELEAQVQAASADPSTPPEQQQALQQQASEARRQAARATAIAKVSSGKALTSLTTEELAAAGLIQDGATIRPAVGLKEAAAVDPRTGATPTLSPIQLDTRGNPIITDRTVKDLQTTMPAVAALIRLDESAARQQFEKTGRASERARNGTSTAGVDRSVPEGSATGQLNAGERPDMETGLEGLTSDQLEKMREMHDQIRKLPQSEQPSARRRLAEGIRTYEEEKQGPWELYAARIINDSNRNAVASRFISSDSTEVQRATPPPLPLPEWLKSDSIPEGALYDTTEAKRNPSSYIRRLVERLEAPDTGRSGRAGAPVRSDAEKIQYLVERRALREFDPVAIGKLSELTNLGRNEHRVYHVSPLGVAFKLTKPGEYGPRGGLATYLKRLGYLNEKFGTNYKAEGVVKSPEGKYSFIISQPWISNARPATQTEIDAFFRAKGYGKYSNTSFWDSSEEVLLSDADTSNVLAVDNVDNITIYPIDIIPDWVSPHRVDGIQSIVDAREEDYRHKENGNLGAFYRGINEGSRSGEIQTLTNAKKASVTYEPSANAISASAWIRSRADQLVGSVLPSQRDKMRKVVDAVAGQLDVYESVFPGGVKYGPHEGGGGMRYDPATRSLEIDLDRIARQVSGTKNPGALIQAMMREEVIHRAATDVLTREEVKQLWTMLPENLKRTVRDGYFQDRVQQGREMPSDDAWSMGHEWHRSPRRLQWAGPAEFRALPSADSVLALTLYRPHRKLLNPMELRYTATVKSLVTWASRASSCSSNKSNSKTSMPAWKPARSVSAIPPRRRMP